MSADMLSARRAFLRTTTLTALSAAALSACNDGDAAAQAAGAAPKTPRAPPDSDHRRNTGARGQVLAHALPYSVIRSPG